MHTRACTQAGGLTATTPGEAARALWAFATLGHSPSRLLATAAPGWAWQAPGRASKGGCRVVAGAWGLPWCARTHAGGEGGWGHG